jgi:hypothetical protein
MASERDDDLDTKAGSPSLTGSLSRRQVLTAGLAAAGAGATSLAAAPAAFAAGRPVAEAQPGATAAEFRARFAQTGPTGEHFTAYGYLTAADGATDDDLFLGASLSDTTALLTAYAEGELVRRTVDQSVHSLDIEGTLTIYQRAVPGASFADPASFTDGTPVAAFDITLQDIVTVFATGKGLPTLTGDLRQTQSGKLNDQGGGRNFGHVGARSRLFATGIGTLLNPATFNSILEMAGNWTTK